MSKTQRYLFLVKQNQIYGEDADYSNQTKKHSKAGLFNSARFLKEALEENFSIQVHLAICSDGNSIDKEVHGFKPDICLIEAIWVTPDKFKELVKLHPKVKFIVRIHSKTTFLANEGNAMAWIKEYKKIDNVEVAFNEATTTQEFNAIGIKALYLPNIYYFFKKEDNSIEKIKYKQYNHYEVNIGCFGAIRPMKNQLEQAVAAIRFGEEYDKRIRFHINIGRVEQRGENILKNIRALFTETKHELVEHQWLNHNEFVEVVKKMDVGLQVSLSESFNIVAADFVASKIPIIVSKEITWMPEIAKVEVDKTEQIVAKIKECLNERTYYAGKNLKALKEYNKKATNVWGDFIQKKGKKKVKDNIFGLITKIIQNLLN